VSAWRASASFAFAELAAALVAQRPVPATTFCVELEEHNVAFFERKWLKFQTAPPDPNVNITPNVTAVAYTNNVAGATSTVLYDIDDATRAPRAP
jgi:hypothetical protein